VDASDADSNTPGLQLLEGHTVSIKTTVSDDVQVRNVELLVNGKVVSNDAAFPFDLTALVPAISAGSSVTLQVRATDTGGNSSLSNLLTLPVVADTFAPQLQSVSIDEGARRFFVRSIDLQFDEPLDPPSSMPAAPASCVPVPMACSAAATTSPFPFISIAAISARCSASLPTASSRRATTASRSAHR
jgi:hypothetical protein